jgi:hypothetical protein
MRYVSELYRLADLQNEVNVEGREEEGTNKQPHY